jgi:hypothetical protein
VKLTSILFALLIFSSLAVYAQEKGVDNQSSTIRDTGNNKQPGNNGTKTNTGAGRGIDFGKGRTPPTVMLPNPYRVTARKDAILQAVQDLMEQQKMVVDTAASKPLEGIIISQPYTFIRGAVVAESELSRYTELPAAGSRGWTRGRYTLIVEIQPIDAVSANISVNAKIEGRSDGASGAEWISLRSNGTVEQEFLNSLVENITGTSPNPPTARP